MHLIGTPKVPVCKNLTKNYLFEKCTWLAEREIYKDEKMDRVKDYIHVHVYSIGLYSVYILDLIAVNRLTTCTCILGIERSRYM